MDNNDKLNKKNIVIKEKKNIIKKDITFIDLFCGIGSFHYSFLKNNWKCIMACDIYQSARENYYKNYNIMPLGDICEIEPKSIKKYDILCAGFPCFVKGTLVLTSNGYKNIEHVKITDKLLTHTGKFNNILNLQRKIYTGNLFQIKSKYNSKIITTTEEHPFFIREKKEDIFGVPLWKNAKELTMNDYFGMVINKNEIIPEFTFKKLIIQNKIEKYHIKLDKLEYWFIIGYFVRNGWIKKTKGKYKIEFTINSVQKKEIFDKINKVIPIIINKKCNTNDKYTKIICYNFIWYNVFKQFIKYNNKKKAIPELVQDLPKMLIQEFINGYTYKKSKIITSSINIAYNLQRLNLKLGHNLLIKYANNSNKIIPKNLYYLKEIKDREKKISFIEDNYVWFAPYKITKRYITEIPVYNFEVENDNSYIIENTIVHNCQPFSQIGKHLGFNDERGTMFYQIMKFIKYHKPKIIILENVQALLNHDNGKTFQKIYDEISKENYEITYKILTCSDYGIPQMRKRLFIIGVNKKFNKDKIDINTIFNLDEYKENIELSAYLGKNFKKNIAYTIRCGGKNSPINDKHNWDGYFIDDEIYRLSIDDALKLQGFTENFELIGTTKDKWKLLGNTIPTNFTKIIGTQIKKLFF